MHKSFRTFTPVSYNISLMIKLANCLIAQPTLFQFFNQQTENENDNKTQLSVTKNIKHIQDVQTEDWNYIARFFDDRDNSYYLRLLKESSDLLTSLPSANRVSYVLTSRKSTDVIDLTNMKQQEDKPVNLPYGYSYIQSVDWSFCKTVEKIKSTLEKYFETTFDYCLFHLYTTGQANINWHNDKEALNSDVVSVSFGASRKFRLRHLGSTRGYQYEYHLGGGDVFRMNSNCQRRWEHCIPKESTIKLGRINLTFRKKSEKI